MKSLCTLSGILLGLLLFRRNFQRLIRCLKHDSLQQPRTTAGFLSVPFQRTRGNQPQHKRICLYIHATT